MTLPHHQFWTEEAFARERERIFKRCWLYIGAGDAPLAATLAGLTFTVGDGAGACTDGTDTLPLQVDRCGALVFARVAQDGGPTLAEHLAPYGERLAAMSANCLNPLPPAGAPIAANWKALVENTLDDFHGSTVHPDTIHPAVHPDWANTLVTARHGANSDSCWDLAEGTAAWWRKLDGKLAFRRFAAETTYRHVFIFPNFYLASFYGAMVIAHRVEPLTAETSVLRWQQFLPSTRIEAPRDAAFHRSTALYLAQSATRVIAEDRPVCEAVQQGRPGALGSGVYGLREQRIVDFHAAVAAWAG